MKYHRDQYLLAVFQIIAHVALLHVIIYGTWWDWLTTLTGFFLLGCLGAAMTLHRLLAHRSWNSPKWFEVVGTVLANLSLVGSSIAWVALHRQHHRYADKEGDPHRPHEGFLKSQWGLIFETPNLKYATDLMRSPLHIFLHKYYFLIAISLILSLCLIDPMLAASLYLAPAALVYTIGGAINSLSHSDHLGYRNYETRDNSKNIPVLGYLMWGEGWHNNHHARPKDPYLSKKWWELDISGLIIKQINGKYTKDH